MHSTAHRTTSVSNVCKNYLYHLGPHNRFHFLFPSTSSLKLFALSLMLVPLFETFTQLIFTTHKISTSVTPKLDHLAAKILESFKTRYEIIYVHWVDQLEMNHTCVGQVNRQHQRFTVLPPILMYKRQKTTRANSLPDLIWSSPGLAQRDKRRSAEREAVGSNSGRTNTQDL